MGSRTLPDRIADLFIAKIFIGELQAGDRLPAERALAEELEVDRTSLRMALRTLTRMNLIEPVQGSGNTVLNYRKQAGLDFLASVFRIPELELGSDMMLSALDLFIFSMPSVARIAFASLTKERYERALVDLKEMEERIALGSSKEKLAAIEIRLQDEFLGNLGNNILDMTSNSSRVLRNRLMVLLFESIPVKDHVVYQRELITSVAQGRTKAEEVEIIYREYLIQVTAPLRKTLKELPPRAILRASPLQSID